MKILGLLYNRTEAFISKIGNLILSNGLILYDVLVIPEYCVTLIYVHKLAKDNKIFVVFDESRCYFVNQDLNLRNVLRIGNQCDGLYYFDNQDVKFFEIVFPFKDSVTKYPEMPNDDERVDPSLNSDQKSQSDSSHSYVPGRDVNIVDFPSNNSGNDVDSSNDIFTAQDDDDIK
ncbi:hypothetical protein Tco_1314263 [Tanacetum coccineum]